MIERLPDGLRVVRRVRVPQADAFDAWVNPERLRAWFGPAGSQVVDVEGELAVGREFRLRIRNADGRLDDLVWSFREIVPPEKLVFGWSVGPREPAGEPKTVVTIVFHDHGAHTEIELFHLGEMTTEAREMFTAGWQGCFAGLEEILHRAV